MNVRDPALAPLGLSKIDWVATWSPVLNELGDRLLEDGSVRGRRIGVILPLEAKTAYLAAVLAQAGAEVALACPAALCKDDVAAGLAERGVEVFARSDASPDEEREFFEAVLELNPQVVIDDRAELIVMAHSTHQEALNHLVGASELTTSGVTALRAMERQGVLRVPCIAANDARSKHYYDNRYGSGQSVMQAIQDATNLLLAGREVLVVGYGWVGRGVALRAHGLGARVTVAEVDPFRALEAYNDGFEVDTVSQACRGAALVITCTGTRRALAVEDIERLPDGALLANAGGVDDEIDVAGLRARALEERMGRPPHVVEYLLEQDRSVFVIGGGRVVNLSAGDGHPVEIMDLSFSVQALAVRHLLLHSGEMAPGVHLLPPEIDEQIARDKLTSLGLEIDSLTPDQQAFLQEWGTGG